MSGKGWSACPAGTQEKLRWWLQVKGAGCPRNTIPAAQALDHRMPGDTAQDPVLYSRQAEAGRAQDSEKALPPSGPELCKSAPPSPLSAGQESIQASTDWVLQ